MKLARNWFVSALVLLLPLQAFAAADYYLKIESGKGEARVVHCTDGSCLVDQLAPGSYTVLVCDAQGKVIPSNVTLEYTVLTAGDRASGVATGKRMHKPLKITMELGRNAAPANSIAIDEPGVQIAIGVDAAAVDAAVAKITKSRSNIQNN
ncbi:MAG: hypothetical protein ABI616_01335 [Pseudomonadota bacterium]